MPESTLESAVRRYPGILIVLLLLCSIAACDDDDCTTCAEDPPAPEPTLENVWPNEDGRGWTYDFFHREWPDTTTPPLAGLTIDDADSMLAVVAPAGTPTDAHIWRNVFEGMETTESGAVGQNLRGYYYRDVEGGVRRWVPADRPSLAERLVLPRYATIEEFAARRICCVGALLIEGGPAFVKTEELIGSYGDLDQRLSWKWLEADLGPGSGFTLQLVPALADNVFLHAEIREVRDLSTPYGEFENALSVNYMIEHGQEYLLGPDDTRIGPFQSWTFGRMEFVPEVGPVYCLERFVVPDLEGEVEPGLIDLIPGIVDEREYWLIGTMVDETP